MKENIVRYTADEIKAMKRRGESLTDWARVDAMTDEEIAAAVADDPDAVELPEDWPEHAIVGLPESKAKISLRVDAEVLHWFRQQGPRYQSRMNAVLRSFMEGHRGQRTPRKPREPASSRKHQRS